MKLLKYKTTFGALLMMALLTISGFAFAQDTIGQVAGRVTDSFENIGVLMIVASYIGGFALTIAAIFKFKQHKDNPTQIPIGTPIALLVIGIILVFLPSLFGSAGVTIFGDNPAVGGFGGEGISEFSDWKGPSSGGGSGGP